MTSRKRFLVVVQEQRGSERAIEHALELARQNDADLKIDDARIDSLLEEIDNRARNAQSLLARWFERELPYATIPQWYVVKGSARQVIPSFIESHDIELLVMGSVARAGVPGLFIGSTAESVLGDVHCSVLTVKPDGFVSPIDLENTQEASPPLVRAVTAT